MKTSGAVSGVALWTLLALWTPPASAATLQDRTVGDWDDYVALTEVRIESELGSEAGFLVRDFLPEAQARECRDKVERGEICALQLTTLDAKGKRSEVRKGILHHWLGSALVPDVEVGELVEWLQRYDEHADHFSGITGSELLARAGDSFDVFYRMTADHVITVTYNTEHHVDYRHHGPTRISSRSEATRIAELEAAGGDEETEKPAGDDRGFMWRLNSYWRFQQVPGGVVVEVESLSLSRSIPIPLKLVVSPFARSVPRKALESTLRGVMSGSREIRSGRGSDGRGEPRPSS